MVTTRGHVAAVELLDVCVICDWLPWLPPRGVLPMVTTPGAYCGGGDCGCPDGVTGHYGYHPGGVLQR